MRMRGSQIVMECLLEQGVDTVFGYPGGTILNIYDEFELHGYGQKIHHYLTLPPPAPGPPTWSLASPPPTTTPPP